jgi:hypothetical protein
LIGGGRRSAAGSLALLLVLAAVRASAQTPVVAADRWPSTEAAAAPGGKLRVALLSRAADDRLAGRIGAELESLGFDVSRAALPADGSIAETVRRLLADGARAAIVADGHRTDVWIGEQGTDRVALREELEVNESSDVSAVLALRTVEFLRISLGVGGPSGLPVTVAATAAAAPPAPAFARPEDRAWAVDVSSGVLATSGGLGPFVLAGASVRARFWGRFGIEAEGYAPLTSAEVNDVDAAGHEAPSHTTAWLAGAGVAFAPPMRRVAFEAAVGAMAIWIRSTAVVDAPNEIGGAVSRGTGAGYAHGALRVRFASRFAARLDVLAGATFGRISLANITNTRELASFGPLFAGALIGAELRF